MSLSRDKQRGWGFKNQMTLQSGEAEAQFVGVSDVTSSSCCGCASTGSCVGRASGLVGVFYELKAYPAPRFDAKAGAALHVEGPR